MIFNGFLVQRCHTDVNRRWLTPKAHCNATNVRTFHFFTVVFLTTHIARGAARAGLTIVPVVPWEGARRRQGAPINCQIFTTLFLTFSVGLNVTTTTKKGRQLFRGEKVHRQRKKVHVQRKSWLRV